MLQVANKRRIVIDDDDDWPLPCSKSDTNGQCAAALYCREQCVAEGIVGFIDAVMVGAINPVAPISAVPGPCCSDMPALLSDSEDGSVADDDDEPILAPLRQPALNLQRNALNIPIPV